MSARPVLRAAAGGMARRRAQTIVIFMVLLVSTAAATLGLALLVASHGPYQQAFAAQRGAHVAVTIDSSHVTGAQLAATGRLSGVTRSAGPYAAVNITYAPPPMPGDPAPPGSFPGIAATVVGRASPGGALDDLTLRSGRWTQRPGEIVMAEGQGYGAGLGDRITVTSLPGKPQLTVVGVAASVTGTANGWVDPAEVTALRVPGTPVFSQMLYRFVNAGSAGQIRGDVAVVAAALPAQAVSGSTSWLTAQTRAAGNGAILSPFVVAFAIMGLAMSVLIVGNVISGAVVSGYRRIGILKSIGFSPVQVVGSYVAWVAVPAVLGCVVGVALGNLLALPVLADTRDAYGVSSGRSVALWVDLAAPVLMLVMAGIAALLPALRAGRLSAVEAIATGLAPRQGGGYLAHRLLGRLRLPRPMTIGLAAPFARPARTAITLVAIAFGTTAVLFAVGLDTSLVRVGQAQTRAGIGQVGVVAPPGGAQPGGAADQKIEAAILAQPGTQWHVAIMRPSVSVAGLTDDMQVEAFRGDSGAAGLDMISGRWFHGPGEVVVNTGFLTQTGRSLGDTVTLNSDGHTSTARVVGEVFHPSGGGRPLLYTDWRTLGSGGSIDEYAVGLRPGTSFGAYGAGITRTLGPDLPVFANGQGGKKFEITAITLISLLTLMMIVVAGLGVLNTVLLSTRERVHDLGVFKAVGMTPRQTVTMVVCWIVSPALIAALVAVPAALWLHSVVLHAMAGAADTHLPAHIVHVFQPLEVALVALSGLAIAALGALPPAGWAARSKTATALRAE